MKIGRKLQLIAYRKDRFDNNYKSDELDWRSRTLHGCKRNRVERF